MKGNWNGSGNESGKRMGTSGNVIGNRKGNECEENGNRSGNESEKGMGTGVGMRVRGEWEQEWE